MVSITDRHCTDTSQKGVDKRGTNNLSKDSTQKRIISAFHIGGVSVTVAQRPSRLQDVVQFHGPAQISAVLFTK